MATAVLCADSSAPLIVPQPPTAQSPQRTSRGVPDKEEEEADSDYNVSSSPSSDSDTSGYEIRREMKRRWKPYEQAESLPQTRGGVQQLTTNILKIRLPVLWSHPLRGDSDKEPENLPQEEAPILPVQSTPLTDFCGPLGRTIE